MIDLDSLAQQFPHARFHRELALLTWHPDGTLDDDHADEALELMEATEPMEEKGFHRYWDMTRYDRIQLNLDHIVRLARRRRRYKGPPVKSAFYAVRLISLNIAHMYEELMEGSRIQVGIFGDREAAAEWLGVPVIVLQRPGEGRRA
jgi:hypothetical protein